MNMLSTAAYRLAIITISVVLLSCDRPQPQGTSTANNVQQNSNTCTDFGPQAPRDISQVLGRNKVVFPLAPPANELNLCNIHIHSGAEHRSPEFSLKQSEGGFACAITNSLTREERASYPNNACTGIKPGDTIEVHWVHTSCPVEPGPGLGACISETCVSPDVRVESQIFTVVNGTKAMDFAAFSTLVKRNGLTQAKSLPTGTGTAIQFLGSTTGPAYTDSICSPAHVTWSVRPACAKVSIHSLSQWCSKNVFKENHAHGARQLITNPALLSPIE